MTRKSIITLHLFLAALLTPILIVIAISGGFYLFGEKGSVAEYPIYQGHSLFWRLLWYLSLIYVSFLNIRDLSFQPDVLLINDISNWNALYLIHFHDNKYHLRLINTVGAFICLEVTVGLVTATWMWCQSIEVVYTMGQLMDENEWMPNGRRKGYIDRVKWYRI